MDYPDSGIVNIGINKERDTQPFFLNFYRVRTYRGKPGKSWNVIISFSRPGKSYPAGQRLIPFSQS